MAMQHPLAKNQKALGQSQREGLSILIPLSPSEVGRLSSLKFSAYKPTDLKNILPVPLKEGKIFTDAEKEDSDRYRKILNSAEASKLSLRNLSDVLKLYGLDIGIVINPDKLVRPRFKAVIPPLRLRGEKSRLVIPLLGIENPRQVGTRFDQPEETRNSIMGEVRRVFSEKELKIILKEYNRRMGLLKADISVLSSNKS
jgi:hypothetical protein